MKLRSNKFGLELYMKVPINQQWSTNSTFKAVDPMLQLYPKQLEPDLSIKR